MTLLFCGAFVSLTTSGRLSLRHLFFTAIAWWFIPALQVIALELCSRLFLKARPPRAQLLHLFWRGQTPWWIYLAGIGALALITPSPLASARSPAVLLAILLATLGTLLWGMLTTVAYFRAGLGLAPGRSGLATLSYYLLLSGSIVSYYLLAGQLIPLLAHTS
ncbi:MAG: hypothetical protein U1E65_09280 [Myxococcota bacterium]